MSFDTALGILSFAIGCAGLVIGLLAVTTGRKKTVTIAALSASLAFFATTAIYYLYQRSEWQSRMQALQSAITQAIAAQPMTVEQITDHVAMYTPFKGTPATDMESAIQLLLSEGKLKISRADWQDINSRRYYTRVFNK